MEKTHFDFKQLIVESRTASIDPQTSGEGSAVQMPKLFEAPAKAPPIMSSEVPEGKASIEIAMRHFTKVFTLWRPWEDCRRCKNAMEGDDPLVVLPDEGDYTCPHVQTAEYKAIVDRCLSGAATMAVKEMFNLPMGARCVHLEWMEVDEVALKRLKNQEELKKQNAVFPPDVEGAFKKDPPREPPKSGKKK